MEGHQLAAPLLNSISVVVERTGLSRAYIYQQLRTGRLKSVKAGSRRLIPEAALIEFCEGLDHPSDNDSAATTPPIATTD